jgi:uncharacterized membrane protein
MPRATRAERGAVAVLAGIALLFVAVAVALTVDLGRIAYERARLQRQVDAAALSAAQQLGTCSELAVDPTATAQSAAVGNGFDGNLASAPNLVQVGRVEVSGGYREFVSTDHVPSAEAVRIAARRDITLSRVLPGRLTGSIGIQANAVAQWSAVAALRGSSYVLPVSSAQTRVLNDVLGALLDSSVNLTSSDYDDLLGASVTLGELVDASASSDGVAGLLALELSAGELLDLAVVALTERGEPVAVQLGELAIAAAGTGPFRVGDLLAVSEESESARDASINLLDLATAAAQIGRGPATVTINPLSIDIPGVARTTLRLSIREPPQIAIGPPGQNEDGTWRTELQTARVRMELSLEALSALGVLGASPVTLTLTASAGRSRVRLLSIQCARAGDPITRVRAEAEPGIAEIGIGDFASLESDDPAQPAQIVDVRIAGIPVARVSALLQLSITRPSEILEFQGPFVPRIAEPAPEHTQRAGTDLATAVGQTTSSIEANVNLQIVVLGLLPLTVTAASILNQARNVLDPLYEAAAQVLVPVLRALGLEVAGVEVTVLSVHSQRPALLR